MSIKDKYSARLGKLENQVAQEASRTKPKKTDVQISIRKNNPAGYVINVYRPSNNKFGTIGSEEFYVARTIEEVETITSSLLRHGSVPKELGGA